MAVNKAFVDTNVLVEILESRQKQKAAIKAIREHGGELHISALSCHIVGYISQQRIGLELIETFLSDYEILSLAPEDVAWAFRNRRNDDFEDALQIACAVRNGCTTFITFDKQLAKDYQNLPSITVRLLA